MNASAVYARVKIRRSFDDQVFWCNPWAGHPDLIEGLLREHRAMSGALIDFDVTLFDAAGRVIEELKLQPDSVS